jgi:ABC-type uncharacterized transport system substrate-binding protein
VLRTSSVITGLLLLCLSHSLAAESLPRCLFVSSYHQGYAWSDGVEKGLRDTLEGRCKLDQVNLDTKRIKDPATIRKKVNALRRQIDYTQPDVIITADDNAAKYLIQPYYIDSDIPFVFCGINWSVKNYGFPASNITGMIEIAPIKPLMEWVTRLVPGTQTASYIGADTLTEKKNYERYRALGEKMGITVKQNLVPSNEQWKEAYKKAQEDDFVIIGSNAGINDWDAKGNVQTLPALTSRISITVHEWMMPYTSLGFTKLPEEQGIWAGQTALAIVEQA